MGLPHTCASILAVFLSLSAQSITTVNAFFTEGGCDVDVAGTEQHCTMAENAGRFSLIFQVSFPNSAHCLQLYMIFYDLFQ